MLSVPLSARAHREAPPVILGAIQGARFELEFALTEARARRLRQLEHELAATLIQIEGILQRVSQ